MIMVKDKLFIDHNIFHQVCFTLLRPEVGVAPQCVGVWCKYVYKIDLDLSHKLDLGLWLQIRSRSTAVD